MKTKVDGRVSVRVPPEFMARVQKALDLASLDLPTVVRALLDAFTDHIAANREVAFPLTIASKAELYRLRRLRSLMSHSEVQAVFDREKKVSPVEAIQEMLEKSGVTLQDFQAAIRNALDHGDAEGQAPVAKDGPEAIPKRPKKTADGKKAARQ